MNKKIFTIQEIKNEEIEILTYGHFNSFHPGHIRYLEYARSKGKNVSLALMGDGKQYGKKKFNFTQMERVQSLIHLPLIDKIILLEDEELYELVKLTNPKTLILGKEYEDNYEKNTNVNLQKAVNFLKNNNKEVFFHSGDINYASTELLTNSEQDLGIKRKEQFKQACSRCNIDENDILNSMKKWRKARILVIGDLILDQYAACEAMGMSAEAPVLVVKELKCRNFVGGAGIVAEHINSLGAKCDFVSVIGSDENAEILKRELSFQGINMNLIEDETRPTTFKKRYLVENQKLFRVSKLEDHSLSKSKEKELIEKIREFAKYATGIVISDFLYGVITPNVLRQITDIAESYNLPLFGDLQCSTQLGSVLKFNNFTLLCPNEKEARIAIKDRELSLEVLSRVLMKKTNSRNLIMKLGAKGFISYGVNKKGEIFSQAFPALVANPIDVTGAGDSLLAVMAIGLSVGENIFCTSAIACCQAALAVKSMGNVPIKLNDLKNEIIKIMDIKNF